MIVWSILLPVLQVCNFQCVDVQDTISKAWMLCNTVHLPLPASDTCLHLRDVPTAHTFISGGHGHTVATCAPTIIIIMGKLSLCVVYLIPMFYNKMCTFTPDIALLNIC